MPKRKLQGPCGAIGCGKPIDTAGYCDYHYHRLWKFGRLEKINTGLRRKHPLYIPWFERKQASDLAPEWLDLWKFVDGVGEKPSPNHLLVKLHDGPYGPSNFAWKEILRRQPGETLKVWNARQWASQQVKHPQRERRRDLYREYGLTLEEYVVKVSEQNNRCAICDQPETAIDTKSKRIKRLAVDHCHKGGHVRQLLCWRCNGVLGRVDDSQALLAKMIDYLNRHNQTE